MKEFKVKVRIKEYKDPKIKILPSLYADDEITNHRKELITEVGLTYDAVIKAFNAKDVGYCFLCWDTQNLSNNGASWYTAGLPTLSLLPSYVHSSVQQFVNHRLKD